MVDTTLLAAPLPAARLTRKGFVAWLRNQPADAVVGEADDGTVCPLAYYLDGAGIAVDCVTSHRWRDVEGAYHRLPPWAAAFVAGVDHGSPWHLVTAEAARALLGAAP